MVSGNGPPYQRRNAIREGTRRDIVDMLVLRDTSYHGILDWLDFLKRVWPLDEMPSEDHRFETATGDITTHMHFEDWDDAELLLDRLKLAGDADEQFMRFIENVVHPLVIPDEAEVVSLVAVINGHLERDGFHLVETDRISGKPAFGVRAVSFVRPTPEPTLWEKVDQQVASMRDQLRRAESELEFQAVGHRGREVMISLAQTVIAPTDAAGDDGELPSRADAARLLDAYIGNALPGRGNEALRKAVRAVVQATSAVLHDRGATHKDAALAAELVSSSVYLVHILSGEASGPGVSLDSNLHESAGRAQDA